MIADPGRAAGLNRIVVNAHYLADQITSHIARQDVVVSHETPEILETGGGLKAALPLLGDGPVMTANSDAIFAGPNPMAELASAGLAEGAETNLLLVPLDRAVGRKGGGDFSLAPDGRLTRGGDYVYTGIQIIRTDRVLYWPEDVFSLNRIWDAAAAEGGLVGSVYSGRWCDVGHPEGLELAEALAARDV